MATLNIAHSPDSDDAFMFYALATNKIETGDFELVHHLGDIESLNKAALEGKYEVTAMSIHAYAYLHEKYALLNSGASMGEGYGPIVVSKSHSEPKWIVSSLVGVPGIWTSAFLALKLYEKNFSHEVIPFDQILSAVEVGRIDCGLIIHEGQLFYRDSGLKRMLDLGDWWQSDTGLPLPLGGTAVRRDLGTEKIKAISQMLFESIRYALDNRPEALRYALQFGRGLDADQADRFVNMYVNHRTLDYGSDGRKAVQLFLDRGFEMGIIPHPVSVDFC